MKRLLAALLVLVCVLAASGGIALADDRGPFTVPAGHKVGDVVIMGQDVVVAGTVRQGVVVLFGNLTLTATARVDQDVVVLGGTINRDQGSQIGGSVYSYALGWGVLSGLGWGLTVYGVLAGLRLLWITCTVLAALFWGVWSRSRTDGVSVSLSPGRLLAIGAIWLILLGIAVGGLFTTLWGIPLGIILVLVAVVLSCIGLGMLSLEIGARLTRTAGYSLPRWQQAALGSGLIVLFTGIPIVGALVLVILITAGIGQMVTAIRHRR